MSMSMYSFSLGELSSAVPNLDYSTRGQKFSHRQKFSLFFRGGVGDCREKNIFLASITFDTDI